MKRKWLFYSITGLLLVGAGLSISIHAGIEKYKQAQLMDWILLGTIGLILFNSGICFFGNAIILKIKLNNSELPIKSEKRTK